MVRGPWHITVGRNSEGEQWAAGVWVDDELSCQHSHDTRDGAVQAVKDAWRRELGEHFADQDFVVTVVGSTAEADEEPVL